MADSKPAAAIIPAATILIARDAPDGLEVFMVKRHHQIDFVAGALVFPGGKVAKGDHDAALCDFVDGSAALSPDMQALAAAAIREAFEESGILFAREAGADELVDAERLAQLEHYRPALEKGEIGLLDMVRAENLRLACDRLVRFAHWITPENMPKRFDTHFFLAAAPPGHAGSHDGRESVELGVDPPDRCDRRSQALECDLSDQTQPDEAFGHRSCGRCACCGARGATAHGDAMGRAE